MDNEVTSAVNHSGNSEVEVNVEIDTRSIAYMLACALFSTGKVDDWQFHHMIQNYEALMARQHPCQKSSVKYYSDNEPASVRLLGPTKPFLDE